jgi:hypothetical protein
MSIGGLHAGGAVAFLWRLSRPLIIAGAAVLLACGGLLALADRSRAATVTGTVKSGKGYQVVLVQADGRAGKAAITGVRGTFRLSAKKLAHSTLHLVRADGSYYGPIVLNATPKRDYCTVAGRADLRLGVLKLRGGYAEVATAPRGRYDTHAPYTVTARRGKPIGAGKAGRVSVGRLLGYRGEGGDLDRDGLVGAFDIDDNGNRILDNVDMTGRGELRPPAAPARLRAVSGILAEDPLPPPPPRRFGIGSNFRLPGGGADQSTGEVCVNANIPGIEDVDGLIDQVLPPALLILMPVMGSTADGSTATLDGLGNTWVPEHDVGGFTYPMYEKNLSIREEERLTSGHSKGPGLLDLVAAVDRQGDAFVYPGATAGQIMPGDAFIERLDDGTEYAGVLNFVFNTVPAVKAYRFDDGEVVEQIYDSQGVPADDGILTVPSGATTVTLTCWRPQRKAAPGETGTGAGNWIDMGKLSWEAPPLPMADREGGPVSVETGETGYILSASSETAAGSTAIAVDPDDWSIVDAAGDKPADAANTITLTLDFAGMFPQWGTGAIPSGSVVAIDLGARAAFGDLASSRVRFRVP